MIDNPLVSIALCTYNGARFLREQLNSIVAQSYPNVEVIVVDDRSTDDTMSILEEYASRYPMFKLYRNEQNLGFTKNFEKAIGLCTGELIALCDQDDIWHPDKISMQVAAMGDNLLVYHDSEFVHQDGSPIGKKMSDLLNLYSGSEPEVFLFFNCVSGHAILMKRALVSAALPLPKGHFHDWWLAYVATNLGSILALPQSLVKYRQHDKSDTNILKLTRDKDNYSFSSVEKMQRELNWLLQCASFPQNRHPKFIKAFYDAYSKRMDSYMNFKLTMLMYQKSKAIFYMRKKSRLSKLNYIYKQVWGAKIKALFGNKDKSHG
ncbi:glycosyltransferase family 2 protein [Mucilaginibacter pallidiroseus]|uniref:Glycosyltransferase family 2 protein n=1 Tax=Mucilaginibacter pallidiroseus TaxID=2599295 RepID=A0A563TXR7_9SPHI|nr:glycosyltransferase family 2 protein [Mucilaginibacter pallidiroseus]TWR24053.1 glycosyltransferase family 2 protein [Mucilaginibacter pallidiroseus]